VTARQDVYSMEGGRLLPAGVCDCLSSQREERPNTKEVLLHADLAWDQQHANLDSQADLEPDR
jgi:hypothetical protein